MIAATSIDPLGSARQTRLIGWQASDGPRFASLHSPGELSRGNVLMVPGRTQNRAGPHRLYVKLAWRLAARGYQVLRLDPSGLGDSGGPEQPAAMIQDVRTVIRWLGPERSTYILGLCEGGALALSAGAGLGLAGTILLAPLETENRWDDRLYFGLLARRAFQPSCWAGLAGLGPRALLLFAVDRMRRLWRGEGRPFAAAVRPERPTLILRGSADPYVRSGSSAKSRRSAARPMSGSRCNPLEEVAVDGADHTFAGLSWEQAAGDAIVAWLDRRGGLSDCSLGLASWGPNPEPGIEGEAVEYAPNCFGFFHTPPRSLGGAILLLAPLAEEARWSRRVLRQAAIQFAAAGYAVLRPDLSGHGDSPLDFADCTVEGWGEEVRAGERFLARCWAGPPVLVGLRFGGLLGWCHAARATRWVLWDPPPGAASHFRHYFRIKAVQELFLLGQPRASAATLEGQLEAGQHVDVAGHLWTPALWRGARALDTALSRSVAARSVCALQTSGADPIGWLQGHRPWVHRLPLARFWELHGRRSVPELADHTIRWLNQSA